MAIPLLQVDELSAENAISELVRDRCSPELENQYRELNGILIDCGARFHLDELDVLWGQLNDQNIDPVDIVPSVDEIMRMSAERALNTCGVEFVEDIPLDYLIEACEILLNFDPTDIPSVLLGVIDGAEDDEESLVKVLSYLGTYEEEQWYPYVLNIASGFVARLRSVVSHEVMLAEGRTDEPEGTDEQLKRLTRLVRINRDSLGAELGTINAGIGASMESLYGCHVDKLLDLSTEAQVDALFSLATISNENFDQALVSIGGALDDLIPDLEQRRKAEQAKFKLMPTYRSIFGGSNEEV